MIYLSWYQYRLQKWQKDNFGGGDLSDMIHGMSEEVGEMNHWYLKSKQGIRGTTPKIAREKMVDAFGDVVVFGIQAMTALGVDVEASLIRVFEEVLARNWKDNPDGIGYSQHNE
jgi:NTP pyrophosphatase (non-canonical NTP hydrolase)